MKKILTIATSIVTYVFVGLIVPVVAVGGFPDLSLPWRRAEESGAVLETLEPSQMEDWGTLRREEYGFEIRVPETLKQQQQFAGKALNVGVGVAEHTPVWKFTLSDPQLMEDTNLLEASLVIHVSQGKKAAAACSEPHPTSLNGQQGARSKSLPTVKINGRTFWVDEALEGVMGGFYRKITYSTVANEACYEITQLLHTLNRESFAGDSLAEVPREEVLHRLDHALATFKVLKTSPKFPQQKTPSLEPALTAKSLPKASNGYVDGIDVSHWQGEIDWPRVANTEYKFAFVKATEGTAFTDWYFKRNMDNGSNEGMLMSAYHFARPDLDNSGAEEAEYFLSVVGEYIEGGYLRPVLDLEVSGGLGRKALSDWVVDWMETVEGETGVEPLLYTNYYYIDQKLNSSVVNYDLWIAYWNCDPSPSVSVPPTGDFADWDFWQYQAPTACGNYSIPGIVGNVDLNIFNGGETELSAFESDAPLWVSLVSDAHEAPVPYYADMTARVHGSETGPIEYQFWWDCNVPGVDLESLQTECGSLPAPDPGQCLENEHGMRCAAVSEEIEVAEHTYTEIGDYVPKVVVHRGEAAPAEDRYQILTFNPILSLEPRTTSPLYGVIGEDVSLTVDVRINTSLGGALQVDVLKDADQTLKAQSCQEVGNDVRRTLPFDLTWSETDMNPTAYTLWARYRPGGTCPAEGEDADDRSRAYEVIWGIPALEMYRSSGEQILAGAVDQVGAKHTSLTQQGSYRISNAAGSTALVVEDLTFSNPDNIVSMQNATDLPLQILPGEEAVLDIQYMVDTLGPFTFDLNIHTNDPDHTPFTFSVEGEGSPPFGDVPADHWAYLPIEDLLQTNMISGCSVEPRLYCPDDPVTRAESAVFLVKGIHGADYSPPDLTPSFTDTVGHWAEDWIEVLAGEGVTAGCGSGNFCPDASATRAQMAVFLLRAKYGTEYVPPPASGNVFRDVSADHWAADWIESLAAEGITFGCGDGIYCPERDVSRAQMAVFIRKTFEITP